MTVRILKKWTIYPKIDLILGKDYEVLEYENKMYKIRNESGNEWWYYSEAFRTTSKDVLKEVKCDYKIHDLKIYAEQCGKRISELTGEEVEMFNVYREE